MAQDNAVREVENWTDRKPKRIALDFDGVLHMYSKGWQDGSIYDKPVPGARNALEELRPHYDLVVFTCREPREDVEKWLEDTFGFHIEVTNEKPHADMYIDDRGYYFNGSWQAAVEELITRDVEGWKTWCRR